MLSCRALLAACLVAVSVWPLCAQQPATSIPAKPKYELVLTTDHADARYQVGDNVVFSAELKIDGQPAQDVQVPYSLLLDDLNQVGKGGLTFAAGRASVTGAFTKPSFLLLVVTLPEGSAASRECLAGAACEPEKIAPSLPKPDDFDAFWNGKKAQLDAMVSQADLKPVAARADDKIEIWAIMLDNINGTKIHGYFAKPQGNGPFPAYMEVHAAGVYSVSPDTVSSYARRGVMAITINPHEIENGKPPEYYEQLRDGALRDYSHIGRDSRDTCYFLRMFCSCYRAAQYISSRPEWDGKHFVVYGSSQGGGQAFVTAGLCPKVTAFVANVPALCDHTGPEAGRAAGWPKFVDYSKRQENPRQLEASRYFDAVNFAYGIKAKALVSSGFIDRTCCPGSVYAACNVLTGPKRVFDTPRNGHECTPAFMAERARFVDAELGLAPSK